MAPSSRKLEAAGCKVTRDDTSLVFLSVVCSFAHGLYGSCFSALAASIPQLAPQLEVSTSDFGMAYTCRGIGYLFGTLLSAYILQIRDLTLSKAIMACISLIFIGITMFFIAFASSYYLVLFLFLIQGLGFGGMDMMVNCAVPELWGLRAQPWMQGLHTMFGIGSFVGPFFVGFIGYKMAFIVIAFCCFTPLGLLFLGSVAGAGQNKQKHSALSSNEESAVEGGTSIEMVSVHGGLLQKDSDIESEEVDNDRTKTSVDGDKSASEASPKTFPLTAAVKYLTCVFYFVYTGCSAAFAAWITVYALEVHVTDNNADAAYLTSVFWLSMTVGRIIAIFVAVYLSSTTMLRIKLTQCVVACVLLLLISDRSYASLVAVTIVFGYADSSIFPLGMTVLTDYGFEMDPSATLLFMVGTTMGEAVLPAVFGFCVQYTSPAALPWLVTACTLSLIVVYVGVDNLGNKTINEYERSLQTDESLSRSPTGVEDAIFSPLSSSADREDDSSSL